MGMEYKRLGIDIGSTTAKFVILDQNDRIQYRQYRRHNADVRKCLIDLLSEAVHRIGSVPVQACITGSAGMSFAESLKLPFIQEVIACTKAVELRLPETDVAIELGGEDAKVTFYGDTPDQRMNSSCAGGTGAFIDQMASLLDTDPAGLDELASRSTTIYPIAARCGVFAKTDIQPLLNEGAAREDIAASIFQAVVNQVIGGLAQGRRIEGQVALLGGPLHFLASLRHRFAVTLDVEELLVPEESLIFVALGAALLASEEKAVVLTEIRDSLMSDNLKLATLIPRLPPLFNNEKELVEFRNRHARDEIKKRDLESFSGPCYLGIDAGSTTTKAALIDEEGTLLYSHYGPNGGSPLDSTVEILKDLYGKFPEAAVLAGVTVTGYGERLLKTALQTDFGEIETVAHYEAARFFLPEVDFILDIGGQDMKFMRIKDGAVDEILLNEACSSGCGSFIETFAVSLNMDVRTFSEQALMARQPVDLGSRCTVFMNSRVKQAQKEGLTPGDISAGLSYSVIKNALTKVIKIKRPEDYGNNVIVQGGTFKNDAVLRAFELISEREAIRPDISGIAGAFGAALIARERTPSGTASQIIRREKLKAFGYKAEFRRCPLCANHCRLTVTTFSDERQFISGNRCERGEGVSEMAEHKLPNLMEYKYHRTFSYKPIPKDGARAVVGIPRALNMYENYPFWFTFLTNLNYRVILSRASGKKLFESGLSSIPAESVCYPAKLTHGHIIDLINKKVDIIFYPSIPYENKEDESANNHYNCPIVAGYPELIRANVDGLNDEGPEFLNPFLSLQDGVRLEKRLIEIFSEREIPEKNIRRAYRAAQAERDAIQKDIQAKGDETLRFLREQGKRGIVLAGRPYHIDPEINHGIPELITGLGMAVLTEDSIAHHGTVERPLRIFDQWTYQSRLYRAAHFVSENSNLELVQLNSFGCGIDAITTDQVHEILRSRNKIYTVIKIDEGQQLGAARIRLRSLKAVLDSRKNLQTIDSKRTYVFKPAVFEKKMKPRYSIIAPQMSPIHFEFVEAAFQSAGYNISVLNRVNESSVDKGLKYVNNDACYPTILTVGQIMEALESGQYDPDRTAVVLTQTGGGCRATNYIAFMRKALADAGMSQVPVISLNALGLEKHPGFSLSPHVLHRGIQAIVYGDLLMRTLLRTRPYEKEEGSANRLYRQWAERCKTSLFHPHAYDYRNNIVGIVKDFDNVPLKEKRRPRIGLVGEILVKFHPAANNQVIEVIEREGGEVIMPDLFDFFLYSIYNQEFKAAYLSAPARNAHVSRALIKILESYRREARSALKKSRRFGVPMRIDELARKTEPVVSVGLQMGEGWFLTGEMIELLDDGADGVICMQPFACLPNQITGKGMIKALKGKYPSRNIIAVDYDPGASEVNQLNRIKLMMSDIKKKIKEDDERGFQKEIA